MNLAEAGHESENEESTITQDYQTWKDSLGNEPLASFIDFCITRIEVGELREKFIAHFIKIDAEKIPQLFEHMLGIKISGEHELELPKRKIGVSATTEGLVLSPMVANIVDDTDAYDTGTFNILRSKAPDFQQKKIPGAVCAPLSPAMEQFARFQEWLSSKNTDQVKALNSWLTILTDQEDAKTLSAAIKDNFNYDAVKSHKLKRAKQREFLDWYEEEIQKIVNFFATQEFRKINNSAETYGNLLKTWKQRFAQSVVEIKNSFEDDAAIETVLSNDEKIAQLIELANRDLGGFYANLSQRAVDGHYFYHSENFTRTSQNYYQQYLNEQNLALQQKVFEKDPEAEHKALVIKTLGAEPEVVNSLYNRARQMLGLLQTGLTEKLNPQTLQDLLHKRVLNSDNEEVPLYSVLSDKSKELLKICLDHNSAELDNFIKKHGIVNAVSWALPIVSYMGECVYFVADFILRADSFKPIFEAFDLGFLLKEKQAFLALNLVSTFFVVVANVTFDPKAEAQGLMKEWCLNPKGSESHVLFQLKGFFDTHIIDVATKNKLLAICFAGMAFSGAAIETIAIDLLKPYCTEEGYKALYGSGAAFLITSGVLYYFFMNFKDIIKGTPKAIEDFKSAAYNIFHTKEGELTFDSASLMEFQQMLVAIVERTFRMAYGPFAFMQGMGQSAALSYGAGVFGGLTTSGTTFATRVYQIANAYHLDEASYKEALVKANALFYGNATRFQRAYMRMGDPFTIPAVGMSYILARISPQSINSNTGGSLLGTTVFFISLAVMLKIAQSSADAKIINRLASQKQLETTWALRLSQVSCGVDQFSRSVGFISILAAVAPDIFNTQNETNKLCIQAALILSLYLGYAAYTYQSSKTNAICQGASDWIKRKAGQYCAAKSLGNSSIFATNDNEHDNAEKTLVGRESQGHLNAIELTDPSERLREFSKIRGKN